MPTPAADTDPQSYDITAEMWLYNGEKAAWHFITLPKDISQQIKFFAAPMKRGWGSVRVTATIGDSRWETSIFPDSKKDAYILPVKADIRKRESLKAGDSVSLSLIISGI